MARQVGLLTKQDLEAWVVWMRVKGMKPGACNAYIRAINSFTSWLRSEGIDANAPRLKLLACPLGPPRTLTDGEIKRGLANASVRSKALLALLLDTGVRVDEALGLRWEDVRMGDFLMSVTGKGSRTRMVPFSPELRKVLFRHSAGRERGLVFATRDGLRLSYRNVHRDLVRATGRPPHSCRHTWATNAVRRGVPLPVVQRILGHSSVQTTMRYVHMQTDDLLRHHVSPLRG